MIIPRCIQAVAVGFIGICCGITILYELQAVAVLVVTEVLAPEIAARGIQPVQGIEAVNIAHRCQAVIHLPEIAVGIVQAIN